MKAIDKVIAYKNGELPTGLGLYIPAVDDYFVYKPNSFNCFLGRDNVGKTFFQTWYFITLAKLHNLKFQVFAKENETYSIKIDMIEFLGGKSLKFIAEKDIYHFNHFIDEHFIFIEDGMQSFDDVMLKAKDNKVDCTWIDPYNALTIPKGVNSHQYDYEIVRKCNELKKVIGSIYISIHPVTALNREKINNANDRYNGYPEPARKWHSEGGGKWQNAVDQYFSIHRFTTHPEDWKDTRIYVEKIRDTKTGGKPTPEEGFLIFSFDTMKRRFTFNGADPLSSIKNDNPNDIPF